LRRLHLQENHFYQTKGMRYLDGHSLDVRMSVATFKANLIYTILMEIGVNP